MTDRDHLPVPGLAPDAELTPAPAPERRRRIRAEVLLLLGVSLGQSAVYSIVSIVARLTADTALGDQSASLNTSASPRPYLDLTYQLLGIAFALVPVILAVWLIAGGDARAGARRLGFDLTRPWRDLALGFALAAGIGIPGLAFYLLGRAMGITVSIDPAALNPYWWSIPILLLAAVKNAVLEEVLVAGYLLERLEDMGWPWWRRTAASALLRGSYHLYQGIGPFLGNAVMGLVFNEYYRRSRRTMPLVVAHTLIDTVAFVGYFLLPASWIAAL